MKSILRSSALVARVVAVASGACGGDAADGVNTPPSATGQTAAAPQPAGEEEPGAFSRDHASYRLTMPAVRRWFEAQEDIYRAMGDNPGLANEVDSSDVEDVEQLASHFNGIGEVRAAVRDAGLDIGEYTAILITMYYVIGVDAAIQSGADRAALLANQQVDPANLEFVEQNRAELERLQSRLEAMEEVRRMRTCSCPSGGRPQ